MMKMRGPLESKDAVWMTTGSADSAIPNQEGEASLSGRGDFPNQPRDNKTGRGVTD
jgi:hypothetical protein